MSSIIPKTGLAKKMREWMQARTGTITQRRFTTREMKESMAVIKSDEKTKLRDALKDFVSRGEVKALNYKKCNRRQYIYVFDKTKNLRGILNKKIFKSIYVSRSFSVSDVQRLTGASDRHYIDRVIRKLKKEGYLQRIARRQCIYGSSAENIYHLVYRDKFKLEIMRGG